MGHSVLLHQSRVPLYVNFKNTEENHVGIPQPACINCGNCCGGCNTGAKNTLNMNYLPDAKAHGAKMFTEVGCEPHNGEVAKCVGLC